MNKNLVAFAIFALVLAFSVFMVTSNKSDQNPPPQVPVIETYENKVIYTTDMDSNIEDLKADCAIRGGQFNECGSVCPPDAEVCPTVCALVCEIPN